MRVFNRLFALVLGVAVAAGGVLMIIEAIWTGTNSGFVWIPGNEWLTSFKTTSWSSTANIAISIAVAVVGLILLLAEIRPQRKRVAKYSTDSGNWLLLRRSTENHLQRRLAAEVATSPIKVRLKPRALRWRLKVKARAAGTTRPVLEAAARKELARLHAPDSSRIDVKATRVRTES